MNLVQLVLILILRLDINGLQLFKILNDEIIKLNDDLKNLNDTKFDNLSNEFKNTYQWIEE